MSLCKVQGCGNTRETDSDYCPTHKLQSDVDHLHWSQLENPFQTQVAGSHYTDLKIQPMEYALANNLGPCEYLAIKYLSRQKGENRVVDLRKAIHSIELLIADIEGID